MKKRDERKTRNGKIERLQPRKDNDSKRVNFDNVRKSKFKKDLDTIFARSDSNDIRWYNKNNARLQAAGRIPFSSINGVTFVGTNTDRNNYTVPGIMALRYTPNFVPNTAVIEQAYQNLYSEIVHANSRNQSYDYTDLAIMMNAGTEIFAAIALGIRAYGIMRNYEEPNVYTPAALIRAAGFKYSDLRKNYSHMWDDLLQLIAQSRQIWIPNSMPIIERRIWMNLNIYKDSNGDRAQYYMYTPMRFYQYEGFRDRKGGILQCLSYDISQLGWTEYVNAVQGMIDRLIPDQDRGIMYGDILKAYGQSGIFAMNEIDVNYRTVPTYNPEVLWQIENATMVRGLNIATLEQKDLHLSQRYYNKYQTSAITGETILNGAGYPYQFFAPAKAILNFHQSEQPTPEQLAIATRMTAIGSVLVQRSKMDESGVYVDDGVNVVSVPTCVGTEILNDIEVYYRTVGGNTLDTPVLNVLNLVYKATGIGSATPAIPYQNWSGLEAMCINAFDWAPWMYFFNTTAVGGSTSDLLKYKDGPGVVYPIGDYDNYVIAQSADVQRLHLAVIYSLFNVPTL